MLINNQAYKFPSSMRFSNRNDPLNFKFLQQLQLEISHLNNQNDDSCTPLPLHFHFIQQRVIFNRIARHRDNNQVRTWPPLRKHYCRISCHVHFPPHFQNLPDQIFSATIGPTILPFLLNPSTFMECDHVYPTYPLLCTLFLSQL